MPSETIEESHKNFRNFITSDNLEGAYEIITNTFSSEAKIRSFLEFDDVTEKWTLVQHLCNQAKSTEALKIFFETIKEKATTDAKTLIKEQISKIRPGCSNENAFFALCGNSYCNEKMFKYFMVDVLNYCCGNKIQISEIISAKGYNNQTPLLELLCNNNNCNNADDNSGAVLLELCLTAFREVEGTLFVQSQLTHANDNKRNALHNLCSNENAVASSEGGAKMLAVLLAAYSSEEILKEQLSARDAEGMTPLCLALCQSQVTAGFLQVLLDKTSKVGGGADFLMKQLGSEFAPEGFDSLFSVFLFACAEEESSIAVFKLLVGTIRSNRGDDGADERLKSQLKNTINNILDGKNRTSDAMLKLYCCTLVDIGLFESEYKTADKKRQLDRLEITETFPGSQKYQEYKKNPQQKSSGSSSSSLEENKKKTKRTTTTTTRTTTRKQDSSSGAAVGADHVGIKRASLKKFFDFFDLEKTGSMDKSAVCAALIGIFPMASPTQIEKTVREAEEKENVDFDAFCKILTEAI